MYKTKERKRIKIAVVSILALALLLSCIVAIFGGNEKADAFVASKIASQSTNLGELLRDNYNDGKGKIINETVFWQLIHQISGVENPDENTLGTLTVTTSAGFRSINGKDVVVTIGGKKWTATYLSHNNNGDPILTLWLASCSSESGWNVYTSDQASKYPCDMYGTSYVRARALNNGGEYADSGDAEKLTTATQNSNSQWAIYTMTKEQGVKGSLAEFIEVPNNMSWQHSQSSIEANKSNYDYNNDGLDSGALGLTDVVSYVSKTGYKNWANDRLWLPSCSETGIQADTANGIWKTSMNQRECDDDKQFWFRSAYPMANTVYVIGGEGLFNFAHMPATESYYLRPAFHLNLNSVAESFALDEPTNVDTPYIGQSQTLSNIDASKRNWYDSTIMKVTYPSTGMIDVGTYQVKVEITAEDEKFKGAPKKEGESEKVRIFTFTITPKKIGVNVAKNTSGLPVVSLSNANDVYTRDTEANGQAPKLGFHYTGDGYNSDTLPTAVGTYTATAKITNTDTCKNYVLDKAYSIEFRINKKDVTQPAISGQSSKAYIGDDIEFTLTGGNNSAISFELPDGMSWKNDDRNTNTLIAKNAKKYTVKATLADNGESTQWSDGTVEAMFFEYEITKKPLSITITSSAGWEWNVGNAPTITIDEDSYLTDTTDLYIYYIDSKNPNVKHDSINNNKVTVGNTRTITMPGDIPQGSYTIGVELYGSNNDNDNYSLDVPKTAMFTVKGSKVTIDASKLVWMYNTTEITDTSNVKLTYNGNAYQFSVDADDLKTYGAKVDITKGTNGYSGDVTATNAKSTYSVTVYITNYDNTYETHSSQYTLNYSIDKAKYDLSELSWPSSNTKEYNRNAQSMEVVGNLPQGLTVTYSGNAKVNVGGYTTTATFKVSDTDNYYVPTKGASDTYEGSFDFDFAWSITQATLDASGKWKDDNGNSEVYTLPTLKSIGDLDLDSMVNYTYYDEGGNIVTSLPSQTTTEMKFRVVATLKDNYAVNYKFKDGTNEYTFFIGKDKYPVTLILKWEGKNIDDAQLSYTGHAITPTIDITQGGVTTSNVVLKYYKDGGMTPIESMPTTVGRYRVVVSLDYESSDLHYLTSDSLEFEFEIIKADFDVSSLKWTYTHTDKDGNEVTATYDVAQGKWLDEQGQEISPMTYDTFAHTLTLVGKDDVDNLSIAVSGYEQIDAGSSYLATVTFTYDTENYNPPAFPTSLAWSIDKAKIDASNIVWGYSVGVSQEEIAYTENLPYTRIEGGEIKYTVKLINVPDELKEFIKYTGTVDGTTEVGSYSTTYRMDGFDTNNYETPVMPSGLSTRLDWEVEAKKLAKPVFDNSWTAFDGEVHDFAEMFGIVDQDWKQYIRIIITKDGADYAGLSGADYDHLVDKECKAIKAGDYLVKFELINPTSNSNVTNVLWLERPDPSGYVVLIGKYEIEVTQWQGSDENATVDLPTWVKSFVTYRLTDSNGNIVNSNDMQLGEVYTKELIAKSDYENDIKITGKKTLSVSLGTIRVTKPIFDEEKVVTYDGNTHTVEEFLKKSADRGVKFEVDEMTNAGEYVITISLDGDIYTWADGSNDSYTVTVKIYKATVSQNTLVWSTNANGLPTLTVRGHSDIEFTYTYFDADGFELSLAEIKDGMEYAKVVARIDNDNYDIIDANKDIVKQVTYDPSNQVDTPGTVVDFGKVGEVLKEWWQVIASVVSIVLIIVFMGKGISYANQKKQAKKTTKDKYSNAFYAGAAGLFGLAMSNWTIIACVLMGLAVASLVFMIIEKSGYKKAEKELENAKDEYSANKAEIENKQRNDQMQMMLMSMLGNNGGGQAAAALDMGAIRGMIDDAMSRNMQQLPEPLNSANNELVQRLIEQNAQNEERIERLMKQLAEQSSARVIEREVAATSANDDIIKSLVEGQKMIMSRLSEQQPVEKIVAREVAVASANDETIKNLIEGQKLIMQRLDEMSAKQSEQPQVIEKIVEKEVKIEVPVEVEKIVEKVIEKEIPIEVEKIIEKEVVKEVKAEVPVTAPPKQKKAVAPKLTLDEAYAALSKTQKKYFDGLRQYALSKNKCKEKKASYFTVFGPTTTNPILKLTIKKDTTVALLKMEDEFMKDIRRDASGDGTKVKVKETEIVISDSQAFETAKKMIDLREDQIDRYQDLLKEQRAIKK